jgi:hypothetical protein
MHVPEHQSNETLSDPFPPKGTVFPMRSAKFDVKVGVLEVDFEHKFPLPN